MPNFGPELLEPIPGDQPCGVDLRFSPEWRQLADARRADDEFAAGPGESPERKKSDWRAVETDAAKLLATKTKDLRLATLLVEASIHEDGFAALGPALRFLEDLSVRFWNLGLYPLPDPPGDFTDRVAALDWVNAKMPDLLELKPITKRKGSGKDYSYADFVDAAAVGREQAYEEGKVTPEARDAFLKARNEGRCLDLYDVATRASPKSFYEEISGQISDAVTALNSLDAKLDQIFGSIEAAPSFSSAKETIGKIQTQVNKVLAIKRAEEPDVADAKPNGQGSLALSGFLSGLPSTLGGGATAAAWSEAESLIRSGQVQEGLQQMTRLAQSETSGRARFQRKLLLADVCLQMQKDHLARAILEELNEQIEKYKLEEWETTDIIGSVWTRLYRAYRRTNEFDKADVIYLRLSRLDPWQALACGEG